MQTSSRLCGAALLVTLCVIPLFAPTKTEARPADSVKSTVTRNGVSLTVTLPRRAFPRNALVRATLRVTNQSATSIGFPAFSSCTWENPAVHVLSRRGRVVDPPPVRLFTPCIPKTGGVAARGSAGIPRIAPGASHTWKVLVVLRGRYVTGNAITGSIGPTPRNTTLVTPRLALRLLPANPPTITPCSPGTCVRISPRPAWTSHGPVFVSSAAQCGSRSLYLNWHQAQSTTIYPPCSNPQQWRIAAGYLNHPVVDIDWTGP